MKIKNFKSFLLVFLLFNLISCGSETTSYEDYFPESKASNYFKITTEAIVEVHYEPGAEPFEGNLGSGAPIWSILEDNLTEIFSYRSSPPTTTVPKSLVEMNALSSQNQSS